MGKLLFLSILLLSFMFIPNYIYAEDNCIKVLVNDTSVDKKISVEIIVMNNTSKTININASELPWYFSTSPFFYKLITGARPNLELTGGYRLSNPIGEVSLKPGKTIKKKIYLTRQFLTLSETLLNEDVILFWSYKPNNSCQRQGGWLSFKQRKRMDQVHSRNNGGQTTIN